MIEFLLLDLDDTILDFHYAEYTALGKTLEAFGIDASPAVREKYSSINRACWERLERGELTRAQVAVGRFEELFRLLGVEADAARCAAAYTENLAQGHCFLPGAKEALERLQGRYKLYLVSNGTASVQAGRLKSAAIGHLFRDIFISQEVGFDKPALAFFTRCFARIPGFDPARAMIVGDSLTSDIRGGKNAGIATCWVNPGHKPAREGLIPDYEIESITQLPALLERL